MQVIIPKKRYAVGGTSSLPECNSRKLHSHLPSAHCCKWAVFPLSFCTGRLCFPSSFLLLAITATSNEPINRASCLNFPKQPKTQSSVDQSALPVQSDHCPVVRLVAFLILPRFCLLLYPHYFVIKHLCFLFGFHFGNLYGHPICNLVVVLLIIAVSEMKSTGKQSGSVSTRFVNSNCHQFLSCCLFSLCFSIHATIIGSDGWRQKEKEGEMTIGNCGVN